jgi:hypothetical protein
LNPETKQRWNILKNHHHLFLKELEVWGHCWIVQQNVDENSCVSQEVLYQGYSYTWFVTCTRSTDAYYVPPKKEKKMMANVPFVQEQSSTSVTSNIDLDDDMLIMLMIGVILVLSHQILLLHLVLFLLLH